MRSPELAASHIGASRTGVPLLLGPSLGTTVEGLWSTTVAVLGDGFHVIGWDLPGHGASPPPSKPFSIADLATSVAGLAADQFGLDRPFAYAGDSVGGAVGLQLLLDHPERTAAAALVCTAAAIGTPTQWRERAALVRKEGVAAVVETSAARWFSPQLAERRIAEDLLADLEHVDDIGYSAVCDALAEFDVRERMGEIDAPVLVVGGNDDVAVPRARVLSMVNSLPRAHLEMLSGVGHLAPVEAPDEVARLCRNHFVGARA